jgi:DNA-binding NarL/FixJ family response regulator
MRVLLADDQSWLRSALRLLLEDEANMEVVGEVGSIRTLPLSASRLQPDLLFLDWRLPGLETNGARQKLIEDIQAVDPNLYVIALINDDNDKSCLLFGADAFVNKAESPERIRSVLQQAVSKKSSVPSRAADGHPSS